MKSLQEWEALFADTDLPVLAETLKGLAELSGNMGEVSGSSISGKVLTDPMMTLKVMRMANQGRSNRFAQPVSTIEHAVMMVGMTPSFNKMLECVSMDSTLPAHAQAGLLRSVARSLHAAVQARDWAVTRLDLNVDEVYIAALLQELGELALWTQVPDDMQMLEALRVKIGREAAEQRILGFRCDELSLALCQRWNLPPLIVSSLIPAECEAHPRPKLVALARLLSRACERGWYDDSLVQIAEQVAEALHSTADDVLARAHRVAAESARNHVVRGVAPPATWLPMLPGPWPEESPKPAAVQAPAEPQKPAAPAVDTLQAVLDEIAAHLDGTLTLHDLMQLVLRGMRRIGLERVVFGLMTPDKSELRAKYIVGAEEGSALKRFRFSLAAPHLLSRVLARQQAFWLNNESRAKVAALLDPTMVELLAPNYFIMSVAVHGRVVGLFYADRGHNTRSLDAEAYESFKALCTRAAEAMGHLAKTQ